MHLALSSSSKSRAAWALGEINDTRAVEPLKSALNDEDENVRTYSAEALGELNDTKAMESQSYLDPVLSANSAKAQLPQNETLNASGALRLSDMNEMQLYENV
jgi:HEAT repeat protein